MITLMMLLAGILSPDAGYDQVSAAPVQPTAVVQTAQYASSTPDDGITTAVAQPSVSDAVYEDDHHTYSTLNGVSLDDTKANLLHKLGQPLRIDKTDAGYIEYRYDDVTVGLRDDGLIYYVSVPVQAGSIELDGQHIALNKQEITDALGTPQFTADDGEGYYNDFYAFKVFTDAGQIVSVDIFDTWSQ
ncbi:hypothetical protein [Paenibacillus campi]|uniref:hypothetical protein n=1 Tax=Paenibacillus campi TaxID=3106031 RepID=UPI002AFEFC24|nr:hypothetical protein [Paenibacillus sp. SGZ-1009]